MRRLPCLPATTWTKVRCPSRFNSSPSARADQQSSKPSSQPAATETVRNSFEYSTGGGRGGFVRRDPRRARLIGGKSLTTAVKWSTYCYRLAEANARWNFSRTIDGDHVIDPVSIARNEPIGDWKNPPSRQSREEYFNKYLKIKLNSDKHNMIVRGISINHE